MSNLCREYLKVPYSFLIRRKSGDGRVTNNEEKEKSFWFYKFFFMVIWAATKCGMKKKKEAIH